MLKKSTLLFVSIFFLLFIGLSDYGYGCHKLDGVTLIQHGSKPCNGGGPGPGDGGGGKVAGEYDVEFDGGPTNFPWRGHANESRISGKDLPGLIDLDFFLARFPVDGANCFLSRADNPDRLGFGGVQRKPGDTAWGQFWFPGCTKAGADGNGDCLQEVLYQLQIFGDFVEAFGSNICDPELGCFIFPLPPGESAHMVMTDWILELASGGLNIQVESCIAESKVGSLMFPQFTSRPEKGSVKILVDRIN